MNNRDPFERGNFYHIYNHGNGNDNIFIRPENYFYFLKKQQQYMGDLWELFSWCLMPNHFHLLVRVKDDISGCTTDEEANKKIYSAFSHFTNGYAKAINKAFNRRGSLFVKTFKRKHICNERYLKELIRYIHLNPVNHKFSASPEKWPHSSYRFILENPSAFPATEILSLFNDREGFLQAHGQLDMAA